MASYGPWKPVKPEDMQRKTQERRQRAFFGKTGADAPPVSDRQMGDFVPASTTDSPEKQNAVRGKMAQRIGEDAYMAGLPRLASVGGSEEVGTEPSLMDVTEAGASQQFTPSKTIAQDLGAGLGKVSDWWNSITEPRQARRVEAAKGFPNSTNTGIYSPELQEPSPAPQEVPATTPTVDTSNQPQMSQVAQLPLEGGAEATRVARPDGSTRWATKNGYMDAATPKATSTNNALGITDEAFSPGGSFSVASGPRPTGMSQAEWDGLSQEEATAIRVAELEKQGQNLQDLRNVRAGRTGEELERAPNKEPLIVGSSFADDFAFADRAKGGFGKLEDALEDKNPKTRRAAMAAMASIYKQQIAAQPQAVGPDFGDQLAQAQMQQNAAFKQAELAGEQQDRMLSREQQALENRRAGTEADQAEVGVLTAQLDKVMGSGQVVPGTEGILNEVMLQKRASPLMVNGVIQEALTSLPNAREALNNSDTDPKALKDKQAALAAIREYVAQKMP